MLRDTMKQRTYDWEADVIQPRLSERINNREEAELIIAQVLYQFAPPTPPRMPRIIWGETPGSRHRARGGPDRIKLPFWAQTKWILLHEIAHTIEFRERSYLNEHQRAAHGPEWLTHYGRLLVHVGKIPPVHITRSAKHYRLTYGDITVDHYVNPMRIAC